MMACVKGENYTAQKNPFHLLKSRVLSWQLHATLLKLESHFLYRKKYETIWKPLFQFLVVVSPLYNHHNSVYTYVSIPRTRANNKMVSCNTISQTQMWTHENERDGGGPWSCEVLLNKMLDRLSSLHVWISILPWQITDYWVLMMTNCFSLCISRFRFLIPTLRNNAVFNVFSWNCASKLLMVS